MIKLPYCLNANETWFQIVPEEVIKFKQYPFHYFDNKKLSVLWVWIRLLQHLVLLLLQQWFYSNSKSKSHCLCKGNCTFHHDEILWNHLFLKVLWALSGKYTMKELQCKSRKEVISLSDSQRGMEHFMM